VCTYIEVKRLPSPLFSELPRRLIPGNQLPVLRLLGNWASEEALHSEL
jgi:hypothetical protein